MVSSPMRELEISHNGIQKLLSVCLCYPAALFFPLRLCYDIPLDRENCSCLQRNELFFVVLNPLSFL